MAEFVYSVWFSDDAGIPDDEDAEWVACIGIKASSPEEAQAWGDTLARDRVSRIPSDKFLRSSIEPKAALSDVADWSGLPQVQAGEQVSDEQIGW